MAIETEKFLWDTLTSSTEAAADTDPHQARDIQIVLGAIGRRPQQEQEMILATLQRYEGEGGYRADASALARFIRDNNLLKALDGGKKLKVPPQTNFSISDLGAGGGDLFRELERLPEYRPSDYKYSPGLFGIGVDLSPSLVRRFNSSRNGSPGKSFRSSMRVGLIDDASLAETLSGTIGERGNVASILTLDRVANPRQLIRNMGLFGGGKILGTLLPVIAEDDNPSRQNKKIVYTPPEKRITPGKTRVGDRAALRRVLKREWGERVETAVVPYAVESSGDRQEYELDVFFTRPNKK